VPGGVQALRERVSLGLRLLSDSERRRALGLRCVELRLLRIQALHLVGQLTLRGAGGGHV
jgi:hypothetical protein